jgi:hypothetical protein
LFHSAVAVAHALTSGGLELQTAADGRGDMSRPLIDVLNVRHTEAFGQQVELLDKHRQRRSVILNKIINCKE